ncbi:hypothetical protein AgCh_038367 [Apium graveolens]
MQNATAVHNPPEHNINALRGAYSKLGHCKYTCRFKDVVHGNSKVIRRADNSPGNSSSGRKNVSGVSRSSSSRFLASDTSGRSNSFSTSSRRMQFRKLSGCYECHMIVDPSRYPNPRSRICGCPECGEIFVNAESLEQHQAVRHAVLELSQQDSGRNIVEIIFKSSWLKNDNPFCNIQRILKIRNSKRNIQRFEDCRDAVKLRANANTKKNPRRAADGNELLRFHCTNLTCRLGARGYSCLCGSVPGCGVCTIIRHGFPGSCFADDESGVRTTASSGRAHDCFGGTSTCRAMLVCRVIAGKIRMAAEEVSLGVAGGYDSVAGNVGLNSSLEDLYVRNPRAILPCFVVIYNAMF